MAKDHNAAVWTLAVLIKTARKKKAVGPSAVATYSRSPITRYAFSKTTLAVSKRTKYRNTQASLDTSKYTRILHVLFFPDVGLQCTSFHTAGACTKETCLFARQETSLATFFGYVDKAVGRTEICMLLITCQTIDFVIISAKERVPDLKVCIIVDGSYAQEKQITRLTKAFMLIDRRCAIFGSFKWSDPAVVANNEDILIASGSATVAPYWDRFKNLWIAGHKFRPIHSPRIKRVPKGKPTNKIIGRNGKYVSQPREVRVRFARS